MKKYSLLFIDDDELYLYLTRQNLKRFSAVESGETIDDSEKAEIYLEE